MLVRHLEVLAGDHESKLKKKLYNGEKWQRQCNWHLRDLEIRDGCGALVQKEADLDLQHKILYAMARAENCRKRLAEGGELDREHLAEREQMLQELLVTTYAYGA